MAEASQPHYCRQTEWNYFVTFTVSADTVVKYLRAVPQPAYRPQTGKEKVIALISGGHRLHLVYALF